jgi:hypothetical protein
MKILHKSASEMEHRIFFFFFAAGERDGAPERGTGVGLERERERWSIGELGVFSGVSLTEALSLSKKEGLRERGAIGEREKERGRERENG